VSDESWRVYIANLTSDVDGDDLARLASPWGTVLGAEVVRCADTGRSKGFGWVDMSCESEAGAAAEGISGCEFRGRRLTVHLRTPPPELPERQYCPCRFRADWAPLESDHGDPEKWFGRTELEDLCREFGRVMVVEVDEQSAQGPGRGCGCVEMDSAAAARMAVARLDGREYWGYRFTARPLKPWEDLRILGWYRRGEEAARTGERGHSPPELRFSPIDDFDPRKVLPGMLARQLEAKVIEAGGQHSQQWPQKPGTDPRDEEARGPNVGGTGDEDAGKEGQRDRKQRMP
jgi:RNA recognition motif. (a.k.a. RRM, RBD, or RNP domain)